MELTSEFAKKNLLQFMVYNSLEKDCNFFPSKWLVEILNRKNRISQKTYESIKEHIESVPKYTSHYSRKKNPEKVYLDHDLSISSLYKDYYVLCVNKNESNLHLMYRRVFSTQ